jgi:hypothetical protein
MTTRHCVSDFANNEGQETAVQMELKQTQNDPRRMMQKERKGCFSWDWCVALIPAARAAAAMDEPLGGCRGNNHPCLITPASLAALVWLRAPLSLLDTYYIDVRMELLGWGVCVS